MYVNESYHPMSNTKTNSSSDHSNTVSSTGNQSSDEFKDTNLKYNLSKFEYDLYHEEDDVAEKVIRVKRVTMPNKQEKWKVMTDNKVIFIIEGTKLSKKEREFLNTVDGFNFILKQAKLDIKSFNSFKNDLKKLIDSKLNNISKRKNKK